MNLEFFNIFTRFDPNQWWIILAVAVLIGLSRTAVSGFAMFAVPIMAIGFGGMVSTGVILPILIFADIYAVNHFRKEADWATIFRIMPATLFGILLGAFFGKEINDHQFMIAIGVIVLLSSFVILLKEIKGELKGIPQNIIFAVAVGVLTGVTSMVGNSAGPVLAIYFLAVGFGKEKFMGTSAWFFFVLNVVKMPIQVFYWKNMGIDDFLAIIVVLPVVFGAAYLGTILRAKINEVIFRRVVLALTFLAALNLLRLGIA